jgi:nicotinate-nucleotide adenylyltransferase
MDNCGAEKPELERSPWEMPDRIGVMGGSFDPVHMGHLRVAEEAVEYLGLDQILFVPAAVPPHKPDKQVLPMEHRWEMLKMAIRGNPRFSLSDVEMDMPGKSYTVKTLGKLHEAGSPGLELYFLVGLDAFLELDTWWHYEELFGLAHMVALHRPGYAEAEVADFLADKVSPLYRKDEQVNLYRHPSLLSVHYLKNTRLEISSTFIRQLVARGRSIRYLVPDEVMRYIEREILYMPLR